MERLTTGRLVVPMLVSFHLSHAAPSSADTHSPGFLKTAARQRWIPQNAAFQLKRRPAREQLTAREIGVLKELVRGLANKEIAGWLGIGGYTAKDRLKEYPRQTARHRSHAGGDCRAATRHHLSVGA